MKLFIVIEVVHRYCAICFSGEPSEYPRWYHEMFAMYFSQHTWNCGRLETGVLSDIYYRLSDIGNIKFLLSQSMTDENTVLDLSLLRKRKFTPRGKPFSNLDTAKRNFDDMDPWRNLYGTFRVIGNYLFNERPDIIQKILRDDANFSPSTGKSASEQFQQSCEEISRDNPILIKHILDWIELNTTWKSLSGTWYEKKNGLKVKGNIGGMKYFHKKNDFPILTICHLHPTSWSGVIVNGQNRENFEALIVSTNGDISLISMVDGVWTTEKMINKIITPLEEEKQQEGFLTYCVMMTRDNEYQKVFINGQLVYAAKHNSVVYQGIIGEHSVTFKWQ